MSSTAIAIDDMHCAACVRKIRGALGELPFVQGMAVNPVRRQVHVQHNQADGDFQLLAAIEALGFHPRLARQAARDGKAARRAQLKRLGVSGICMMQVMMATTAIYFGDHWGMEAGTRMLLRWALLVFSLPIALYAAVPFYRSALASLRQGINMDVPIALAISISFGVSVWNLMTGTAHLYFDSVAMFTFLMLVARHVDGALKTAISTDDERFAAPPGEVSRWNGQDWVAAPVATIVPGDRLRIDEGAALPVDAELTDAKAQLDEAALTGEADWITRHRGDPLFAGTFNRGARLECRALAPADRSRAAQIHRLAEQVALSRSPLARLADRVAGVFVPVVLALAAITTAGWTLLGAPAPLQAGLAVLIVSCPCALALAVPAALSASMANLRRQGLLLTDSAVLEEVPRITQLYFDKTGTLTLPTLSIRHRLLLADWADPECLALARALQAHSTHPIARAFAASGAEPQQPLALTDVETVTGRGIRGTFEGQEVRMGQADFCGMDTPPSTTGIYLTIAARPLACYELGSAPRADLAETIDRLRRQGVEITLLSGDREEACQAIAAPLNMSWVAGLSPEQKLAHLEAHRGAKDRALFVGDGINDGPAFAAADIAVATLETSDLVRSQADATLLSSRLAPLADLFEMSRRCRRVMVQNLLWAASYNLIAIPSAMAGAMPPWLAAIGMATSSVLVLLNATRLLSAPARPRARSPVHFSTIGNAS